MNARERFAPRESLGERLGVAAHRGVDVLTGLQVLTYRFRGAPRAGVERLESPHLPGVLAAEADEDGDGLLVTAISRDHRPLREGQDEVDVSDARAALRALADAARAGVAHGDLHPGRLWRDENGHLLVEGFGAPWGAEASLAADARALSAALLTLGPGLPSTLRSELQDATHQDDPDLAVLERSAREAEDGARAEAPPPPASEPEPIEIGPDADAEPEPPPRDRRHFVKDLPPGGAYRSGEVDEQMRPGAFDVLADDAEPARRLAPRPLLVWLLVAVAAGAAVAVYLARDPFAPPAEPGSRASGFVVDVRVVPEDAPPLQLVVVDAPGGSELTPGTELGRAPRRVVLDREGRWVLQGRFGEQRTETQTLTVPEVRAVTLEWEQEATP